MTVAIDIDSSACEQLAVASVYILANIDMHLIVAICRHALRRFALRI